MAQIKIGCATYNLRGNHKTLVKALLQIGREELAKSLLQTGQEALAKEVADLQVEGKGDAPSAVLASIKFPQDGRAVTSDKYIGTIVRLLQEKETVNAWHGCQLAYALTRAGFDIPDAGIPKLGYVSLHYDAPSHAIYTQNVENFKPEIAAKLVEVDRVASKRSAIVRKAVTEAGFSGYTVPAYLYCKSSDKMSTMLNDAFLWDCHREGLDFWREVYDALKHAEKQNAEIFKMLSPIAAKVGVTLSKDEMNYKTCDYKNLSELYKEKFDKHHEAFQTHLSKLDHYREILVKGLKDAGMPLAAEKATVVQFDGELPGSDTAKDILSCCVNWSETAEGAGHWQKVHLKLCDGKKEDASRSILVKALHDMDMHDEAEKAERLKFTNPTKSELPYEILMDCVNWVKTAEGSIYWGTVYGKLSAAYCEAKADKAKLVDALRKIDESAAKYVDEFPVLEFAGSAERTPAGVLGHVFLWAKSPQGHDFWSAICKKLEKTVSKGLLVKALRYIGESRMAEELAGMCIAEVATDKPSDVLAHFAAHPSAMVVVGKLREAEKRAEKTKAYMLKILGVVAPEVVKEVESKELVEFMTEAGRGIGAASYRMLTRDVCEKVLATHLKLADYRGKLVCAFERHGDDEAAEHIRTIEMDVRDMLSFLTKDAKPSDILNAMLKYRDTPQGHAYWYTKQLNLEHAEDSKSVLVDAAKSAGLYVLFEILEKEDIFVADDKPENIVLTTQWAKNVEDLTVKNVVVQLKHVKATPEWRQKCCERREKLAKALEAMEVKVSLYVYSAEHFAKGETLHGILSNLVDVMPDDQIETCRKALIDHEKATANRKKLASNACAAAGVDIAKTSLSELPLRRFVACAGSAAWLKRAFIWEYTKEGHKFWEVIYSAMKKVETESLAPETRSATCSKPVMQQVPKAPEPINMKDSYTLDTGEDVRVICVDRVGALPVITLVQPEQALATFDKFGCDYAGRQRLIKKADPRDSLKIDDVVEVWDTDKWRERRYAGYDYGKHRVFAYGRCSHDPEAVKVVFDCWKVNGVIIKD